jgi:signal recognition particle subunit SRP54
MHRQMADMMKTMGRNGGLMNKFLGRTGAGPSEAELQSMQAELAKLDPKALEQLPAELKEQLAKGASAPSGGMPALPPGLGRGLPGLGGGLPKGLPGLGAGMPKFPGIPGKKR